MSLNYLNLRKFQIDITNLSHLDISFLSKVINLMESYPHFTFSTKNLHRIQSSGFVTASVSVWNAQTGIQF